MQGCRVRGIAALTAGALAAGATAALPVSAGTREPVVVTIAALGPFSDPTTGTAVPERPAAVRARVKAFNKTTDDLELEAFVCDTQLDPNKTEQCARDAVGRGAVAAIGFDGTTGSNLFPILEESGIPMIGSVPVTPVETSSPVSFPLTAGVPGAFEGMPVALGEAGAETQTLVLTDLGAATAVAPLFVEDAVERNAYELREPVLVPPDQTDFAPIVARATESDPEGMNVFVIGEAAGTFIQQLRQSGYDGEIATGSPFVTQSIIDALGKNAEGMIVVSLLRWKDSKNGRLFRAEMKKYAKGHPRTDLVANWWLSTWVVGELATEIVEEGGTVDASTILEKANGLEDFKTGGMTPPITTTASTVVDSPVPLERYYNASVVMYRVKKGRLIEVDGKFVNAFEERRQRPDTPSR